MIHRTAGPSHYDWEAPTYDAFNEAASRAVNRTIERILRSRGVRTVLDFTCGTGSQVYWLARRGFEVVGCDISRAMLSRGRRKPRNRRVKLIRGDMRTAHLGQFDAVLTISNAVGHLTRKDFAKAMRNIRAHLNPGGIYVFDILDRDRVARDGTIAALTMDWVKRIGGTVHRLVQHSTIDGRGVLTSFSTCYAGSRVSTNTQTLQIYGARELASMLRANGFRHVRHTPIDGSFRQLTIARAAAYYTSHP